MPVFLKWTITIILGAAAGFSYWYYIGCVSGSCAITSSPVNSTIYGAAMGALMMNMFKKETRQPENTDNNRRT